MILWWRSIALYYPPLSLWTSILNKLFTISSTDIHCQSVRTTMNESQRVVDCYVCGKDCTGHPYTCLEDHTRSFVLHVECSSVMKPAIKYEGHGHLLQFRDNIIVKNKKLKCTTCNFNICESYAFTCLYCHLNLSCLHLKSFFVKETYRHKPFLLFFFFLPYTLNKSQADVWYYFLWSIKTCTHFGYTLFTPLRDEIF